VLEFSQIISYALALGIAAAIPGPGMTALVARSVGSGTLAAFSMLVGLMIGDLIFLSFAVFGLAIVAHSFSALFVIIRWFSILPKTIAFYLALVPLVLDLENIGIQTWATVLIPVTLFVLLIVGGSFILAAFSVRRVLSGARAQNILHKGAAIAMAAAAVSMISREF